MFVIKQGKVCDQMQYVKHIFVTIIICVCIIMYNYIKHTPSYNSFEFTLHSSLEKLFICDK